MNRLIALITICLLLATPAASAAKIYKWVDAQGNVHYGERAPTRNAEEMTIRKGPPPAPSSADKPADRKETTTKLLDGYVEQREAKATAEKRAAQEKQLRDENCAKARKNLASQQLGGRRFVMTESGERKFLSTEESEQRLQQSQKDIDEWCN